MPTPTRRNAQTRLQGAGGLLERLHDRFGRVAAGAWSGLLAAVLLGAAGGLGLVTSEPWVFPSLGPTLMTLLSTPHLVDARPRAVVVGHLIGIAAGYLALAATGLASAPSALEQGLTGRRVLAAALSLGLTSLVVESLATPQPPAGATTLIVSLGLLRTPRQLLVMAGAVVAVTVLATGVNALTRVRQAGPREDVG